MTQSSTPQINYTLPPGFPSEWCSAFGEDMHGIWVEFTVPYGEKKEKKAKQRMRWINPGRFTMGSPEGEKEREHDETLHEVTLTQGYWLADTACTQELWEAVMGGNPSHFKGPLLPVENVSWDDCRGFLQKINVFNELPGISLCLPTEAQWEYACRAGTKTPFSFGDQITSDQVNFNGNYPYGGGKKNEYREKTVEVKSLPRNAWGLYQMHGNVWEWCSDWYGSYPAGSDTDPVGSQEGEYRVLRGGSWLFNARDCRSAYRIGYGPGRRGSCIGFRLSRGQGEQSQ